MNHEAILKDLQTMSQMRVALKYGISQTTVNRIATGKRSEVDRRGRQPSQPPASHPWRQYGCS